MTPQRRIREYKVGDLVMLKGAAMDKPVALFVGDINPDGYFLLWKSEEGYLSGKPWVTAAAGSHPVIESPVDREGNEETIKKKSSTGFRTGTC